MQRLLSILILLLAYLPGTAQDALTEVPRFGDNPGNLKMFLHVPANLPDTLTPLVIALHGCNQNAASMARQSGWNTLADQQQFMVLYPQQKRLNNPSNCFNWFNRKDIARQGGELASIREMLAYASKHHGTVDPKRVFVYGLSAGGAMGISLLATLPEHFAAGAVFAAGPYRPVKNALQGMKLMTNPPPHSAESLGQFVQKLHAQPVRYPRLVIGHGDRDKVVAPQNSRDLARQWTWLWQTDTLPSHTDSAFADNPLVQRRSYRDSLDQEVVIFYSIAETGHALPVDPGEGDRQGGATGLFAVDRDYFSTYYVAKDFGLIE